ncbi:SHOCT domain-containing protein [Rhodococcus triatomae]|uniref:SHOCT domain-containing protein n=1 Tax=Rhodococcus triatomae TaxID=300028 RepID=UPI00157C0F0A|nr:SHOCT domain-containing protein [Rhodococcus triatomae]
MDSFWDVLWIIIVTFAFVAYLILLFAIISDLFRDSKSSGWAKAAWVIFLFILPLITALVYLIVKGDGMAKRYESAAKQAKSEQDSYIREVAGTTPTAEIANAKALLDSGTITQAEFDSLKAHALSKTSGTAPAS